MSECKKVLLLGDSRRMGYEPFVREQLKDIAEVYGPRKTAAGPDIPSIPSVSG